MAIVKRIVVWIVESLSEAVLTGALLLILAHIQFRGEHLRDDGLLYGLLAMSVAVMMMFFSTGYLLTTIIARALLKPERRLLYLIVASGLYLIHFEVLNVASGGAFDRWERWIIRFVGPCIALACTLGGNRVLTKWKPSWTLVEPARQF